MGQHPQRQGLRILIGLVGLFSVFGLAAVWQKHNIEQSRKIRDNAPDVLAASRPEPVLQEEGPSLAPGWGRLVLGRPSGAAPITRSLPLATPRATHQVGTYVEEPEQQPTYTTPPASIDPVAPPTWPADQELKVRSGQSLSKIIADAYGRSTPSLVSRLASYNGMENADKLRIGQALRIPVIEKLNELLSE